MTQRDEPQMKQMAQIQAWEAAHFQNPIRVICVTCGSCIRDICGRAMVVKRIAASIIAVFLPLCAGADGTIKSKVLDRETNSSTEIIADTKGRVQKKTQFFFDNNNWAKGAIHFDAKDGIRYKEVFKRDGKGLVLQSWFYSPEDKILGHRDFHYDAKGKAVKVDDYDAAGRLIPAGQRPQPKQGRR